MKQRFWEIDFLRGIAVILMIAFNYAFSLDYFGAFSIPVYSGFWFWLARFTAGTFILLAGISLSISNARAIETGKNTVQKFFLRGTKIFCYGLAITAITWIFFPREFIVFGILHFIGISIIIAQPFIKWKWQNLAIGITIILLGVFLKNFYFDFFWLLWLGFLPKSFYTFDYFPLLPWFGVFLLGLFFGNIFYPHGKRKFAIKELGKKISAKHFPKAFESEPKGERFKRLFARQFCWLGRHSLAIYFLHQPILIAIIFALKP